MERITVLYGKRRLSLNRDLAHVTWTRENGTMGTLELTPEGTLRDAGNEQALDLAAEAWAHDLMRETSA